ncbi:hypothetical protein Nepgr_031358 [Nepenthes gracilis]|uniref:Uncharacterized protein n=1 Tax=Nepenthes gracilis TaxID=150966 RepID=A0AAD3TH83_NEPGR|nr:hypothetical protein Nepgr_031358 [Nepenthes gracilis]
MLGAFRVSRMSPNIALVLGSTALATRSRLPIFSLEECEPWSLVKPSMVSFAFAQCTAKEGLFASSPHGLLTIN